MALAQRFMQVVGLSWEEQSDLARAVWELGQSQRRLYGMSAKEIRGVAPHGLADSTKPLVDRVAWAIPRAAAVVPWRSDCLRQAEAARHWLSRHGIATEMRLGARKDKLGRLDTHAWLLCGDKVVTGGNVDQYADFHQSLKD